MPGDSTALKAQIDTINNDPDRRKAVLKDIEALLRKHGIEDADGLFGEPSNTVLRGNSDSSVIITITT